VENTTTYHEIDFLLPAQLFNIKFSYISQKGLPFVREFVLRLVHLAPMTKSQISIFFGFSRKEAEEAIADLVDRDELTLAESGRLKLTEKSSGYFTDVGDVHHLSLLRDSGAFLSFDLASFTCLGKNIAQDKWKTGIQIRVNDDCVARSEAHVEKNFQRQFNEILEKGLLSKSLVQDEKDSPIIYTVKSVDKIRQIPLRLSARFKVDINGRSVEREDFDVLKNSEYVHELIAVEIDRLARQSNSMDIARAMLEIGDSDTLKLFDSKTNSFNLQFLDDLERLESNSQKSRITFLGPIYSKENWDLLQKHLAPVLLTRIGSKSEVGQSSFIWIAPSDPYWCKSNRLAISLSDFLNKSGTAEKKLYSPAIYLPISGADDIKAARQWRQELDPYADKAHGLVEGFLGGNVEVMLLDEELAVVVYHMSLPSNYPVTLPVGFVSRDRDVVLTVGRLVKGYLGDSSGFDQPNDCGLLSLFGQNDRSRPIS